MNNLSINAIYGLPDNLNFDNSAVVGCSIFTAYGALKNAAKIKVGENIAVIGAGGVGGNIIQLAKNVFGANRIIAIDLGYSSLFKMTNKRGRKT